MAIFATPTRTPEWFMLQLRTTRILHKSNSSIEIDECEVEKIQWN